MRPTGLSSGFPSITACSAASGASVGSTKNVATPSIYAGSGRCSAPANPKPFASRTKWPRRKWPRRSLRQVENSGRLGRGWRSPRRSRDYANLMVPVSEPQPTKKSPSCRIRILRRCRMTLPPPRAQPRCGWPRWRGFFFTTTGAWRLAERRWFDASGAYSCRTAGPWGRPETF
jgi:hypothetical protein